MSRAEDANARSARSLLLCERELDSYRHLLTTFEAESALHRDEDGEAPEAESGTQLYLKQRVAELDQTLLSYKAEYAQMKTRFDELLASRGAMDVGPDGDTNMAGVDVTVREERHARDQLESGTHALS